MVRWFNESIDRFQIPEDPYCIFIIFFFCRSDMKDKISEIGKWTVKLYKTKGKLEKRRNQLEISDYCRYCFTRKMRATCNCRGNKPNFLRTILSAWLRIWICRRSNHGYAVEGEREKERERERPTHSDGEICGDGQFIEMSFGSMVIVKISLLKSLFFPNFTGILNKIYFPVIFTSVVFHSSGGECV